MVGCSMTLESPFGNVHALSLVNDGLRMVPANFMVWQVVGTSPRPLVRLIYRLA